MQPDPSQILPSFATAPARELLLTPTPIPPWMIGSFAVRSPIFNCLFILIFNSPVFYFEFQTILSINYFVEMSRNIDFTCKQKILSPAHPFGVFCHHFKACSYPRGKICLINHKKVVQTLPIVMNQRKKTETSYSN